MTRTALHSIRLVLLTMLLSITGHATAGDPAVNVGKSTAGHSGGAAINGFDPVAYFTQSKPVEGSDTHMLDHGGTTWKFSSAENLAMFKADPAKYAPQYGGYCAYAVSQGSTAPIDPSSWTIQDGKLYLNYNASIQDRWSKDIGKSIADGDANWPKVLN